MQNYALWFWQTEKRSFSACLDVLNSGEEMYSRDTRSNKEPSAVKGAELWIGLDLVRVCEQLGQEPGLLKPA